MYDEVGMASGGQSRHLCKRPLDRVIAVLDEVILEPAARVADHHDMPDVCWQRGDRYAVHRDPARSGEGMGNAHL
jgi:hypothetical protein